MSRIPFLILSFLDFVAFGSEDSDFFDKRGYPASVVQAGHHRAKQIDWQSAHHKLNVSEGE